MEWMDGWIIQDHTVKDRQSLDRGQPGTVPWATNACQCSQPLRSAIVRGRITWRSTQTHTCTCLSPSSVPAALSFGPCIPHRHSYTDNPANEGAATPGGGASSKRLERSKGFWPVGTDFLSQWPWAFELEMHLRIKAEELPGTVLQQRTVEIREELRKCTFFWKELRKCFISK